MMSVPLEKSKNYYKRWNNNLYVNSRLYNESEARRIWNNARAVTGMVEDSWKRQITTADKNGDSDYVGTVQTVYQFAKSPGETSIDQSAILCFANMTKPGVENWEIPVATITESSRHNTKSAASWAVSKRAGLIGTPTKGDFSIVSRYGGNWRCDGGSVQFDGKKWVATRQWTWSPTSWDTEIYDWS